MTVCTAETNARNWENVGKELMIQQGWGGGDQESTDGEDRPVLAEEDLGCQAKNLELNIVGDRQPVGVWSRVISDVLCGSGLLSGAASVVSVAVEHPASFLEVRDVACYFSTVSGKSLRPGEEEAIMGRDDN